MWSWLLYTAVVDIYSESMISAAYEEAEKEEGFAELPVSDKTKAVMGVLKKMRIPGRKKRAGKKEEKSPRPVSYTHIDVYKRQVEFYSWMNDFDAYIVNAGVQPIKVMVKAQEYVIEPGNTIRIPGTKDKGGECDV